MASEPSPPGAPTDDVVFDAALEAFASRGYEGTSVRELGRALGVSHNFVHQRVGSKAQLWYAAVDHGFARLAADLALVDLDAGDDDVDRLRSAMVRYVESMSSRPALLRIISMEATTPGPRLDYLFETYIGPVRDLGAAILAQLREAGLVRTDSVALVYFLMTHGAGGPAALPGLGARFDEPFDPSDAEAVHRHAVEAVDVIIDGLRL